MTLADRYDGICHAPRIVCRLSHRSGRDATVLHDHAGRMGTRAASPKGCRGVRTHQEFLCPRLVTSSSSNPTTSFASFSSAGWARPDTDAVSTATKDHGLPMVMPELGDHRYFRSRQRSGYDRGAAGRLCRADPGTVRSVSPRPGWLQRAGPTTARRESAAEAIHASTVAACGPRDHEGRVKDLRQAQRRWKHVLERLSQRRRRSKHDRALCIFLLTRRRASALTERRSGRRHISTSCSSFRPTRSC